MWRRYDIRLGEMVENTQPGSAGVSRMDSRIQSKIRQVSLRPNLKKKRKKKPLHTATWPTLFFCAVKKDKKRKKKKKKGGGGGGGGK